MDNFPRMFLSSFYVLRQLDPRICYFNFIYYRLTLSSQMYFRCLHFAFSFLLTYFMNLAVRCNCPLCNMDLCLISLNKSKLASYICCLPSFSYIFVWSSMFGPFVLDENESVLSNAAVYLSWKGEERQR